jgi:hypothetical protein
MSAWVMTYGMYEANACIYRGSQQFPLGVLQHGVAADSSAEYHVSNTKLRIRRLKPPLQKVSNPQ